MVTCDYSLSSAPNKHRIYGYPYGYSLVTCAKNKQQINDIYTLSHI